MGGDKGKASATPQNLYDYSRATTTATGLLRDFVRNTLSPAISAYKTTAIDFGSDILPNGSGYAPGAPTAIDGQVTVLLPHILGTDRHVALVGRLFQLADGGRRLDDARPPFVNGAPPTRSPLGAYSDPALTVHTTDAALKKAEQSASHSGPGRELALSFDFGSTSAKDLAPGLRELARHQDDETFCVEFFNSLPRGVAADLIIYGGATANHALATAFASGLLDKSVAHEVVRSLELQMQSPSGSPAPTATLNALAGNPVAAANFARYMMGDPKALKAFMGGLGYWHEKMPGFSFTAQVGSQRAYLSLLSSAVAEMKPEEVRKLIENMGAKKNFPDIKSEDLTAIIPDLKHFMSVSAAAMAQPVPGHVPGKSDALTEWASDLGENMRSFQGLYQRIADIYEKDGKGEEQVNDILFGALAAGVFAFAPEGATALGVSVSIAGREAGGAMTSSVTEDLIKNFVKSHIPWPQALDGKDVSKKIGQMNMDYGVYVLCRMLYNNGLVSHRARGREVVAKWPEINQPNGPDLLFAKLRNPGAAKNDPALSEWARHQHVAGGRTLKEVINSFLGPAATEPTEPPQHN